MKIFAVRCTVLVAINFVLANCLKDEEKVKIFNKIVVNMIEDCYPALASVLVYGEHLDGVAKDLHQLERVNLVLQQKSSSEEVFHPIDLYRSIESVIIIENSTDDIAWIRNHKITSLMKIRTVFILDISDENCTQWNTFNIAWIFGIPSAFHICIFSKTHQEIITYNPINEYAPPSWIFKSKFTLKNYSPASIFCRNYTRENICQDLEFDRTKILKGHIIRGATVWVPTESYYIAHPLNSLTESERSKLIPMLKQLWFGPREFVATLMKIFNLSFNISMTKQFPSMSDKIKSYTSLIAMGSIDFVMTRFSHYLDDDWEYMELAYPMSISTDRIVTYNRGLISPLEKISNYYGYVTLISGIILLLITSGVISAVRSRENDKISFAIFECLRLIINNSLFTSMRTFKIRIFFFGIFLYFLIIQATFSGHLTSFLIKPEFRKNVETIDDLSDPRYTRIDARVGTEGYFANKTFANKVSYDYIVCPNILDDPSVACVDDMIRLIERIYEWNLHYTESLSFNIWSFPLRKNWIMKSRFNKILIRFDQAGIMNKEWLKYELDYSRAMKMREKRNKLVDYFRPIFFNDLSFIFIFLGFGLFLSLLSFISELFIYQKKPKRIEIKSISIPVYYLCNECRQILRLIHLSRDNIN